MLSLALVLALTAGFDWDGYSPTTFTEHEAETTAEHPDAFRQEPGHAREDLAAIHPLQKLRVRASWTGRVRPLAGFRGNVVMHWCSANAPGLEQVRQEIEVKEDERLRWLPIQESLIPPLRAEHREGAALDFYVAFIGGANGEWIYIVAGWRPPATPPPR